MRHRQRVEEDHRPLYLLLEKGYILLPETQEMSAVLDKDVIVGLYNEANTATMTWDLANRVVQMARPNVELYPWSKEDSAEDWDRVQSFVIVHSDGRELPAPDNEVYSDLRDRTLRILRRLRNRVKMDEMAPVSELMPEAPGFSNEPSSGSSSSDWNASSSNSGFGWRDFAPRTTAAPLPMLGRSGGAKRKSQTAKFCRCIKQVRKTIRPRKGSTKESAAIGICVKSVLHSKGRTVKKFKCGKKSRLVTQKRR